MSFFGKILNKLGLDAGASKVDAMLRTPPPPAPAAAPASPAQQPSAAQPSAPQAAAPVGGTATMGAAPAAPMSKVDVAAKLEGMAAGNSQKLNWRTSIVDLLKLLNLDSSLQARKELATELGCPPALMQDSAQMNMWLHKAVMQKLAANGGNVPRELLD